MPPTPRFHQGSDYTAQPVRGFGDRRVSFRSRPDGGLSTHEGRERFVYAVACHLNSEESLRMTDSSGGVHWSTRGAARAESDGSWTLGGYSGGLTLELVHR